MKQIEKAVLLALADEDAMTAEVIAATTSLDLNAVTACLERLERSADVVSGGAGWNTVNGTLYYSVTDQGRARLTDE